MKSKLMLPAMLLLALVILKSMDMSPYSWSVVLSPLWLIPTVILGTLGCTFLLVWLVAQGLPPEQGQEKK